MKILYKKVPFSILVVILILIQGFQCSFWKETSTQESEFNIDFKQLEVDLEKISSFPHPLGSKNQEIIKNYLISRISSIDGFKAVESFFEAKVPNPKLVANPNGMYPLTIRKKGYNIFAFPKILKTESCIILYASHYDTKFVKNFFYNGANDSGSSTAGLLAMMKYFSLKKFREDQKCYPAFVFFDGEEAVLKEWYDGEDIHPAKIVDNTYGSRYESSRLISCKGNSKDKCLPRELGGFRLQSLILLDMIGSKNVTLTKEKHSHPKLLQLALKIDKELNPESPLFKLDKKQEVLDDHIPFIKKGIPSIDLIDFNNLEFWHQKGDDLDTLDLKSIEKVTHLAVSMGKILIKDEKTWLK